MNEIEKLYETAGVEKIKDCLYCKERKIECLKGILTIENCGVTPYSNYPPFTAEKQLELIKFILGKGVYYDTDKDYKEFWFHYTDDIENADYKPFEEAVCEFINAIWQDLTEAEQNEIRRILK